MSSERPRWHRLLLLVWPVVLFATPAAATKPCPPALGPAQLRASVAYIAVGVVVDRQEKKVPYPNCRLADRSACAQWDRSELTVMVERYEKGKGPAELHLTAAWCAPEPPAQAGGRYRFYGDDPSFYLTLERLPRAARRPPS